MPDLLTHVLAVYVAVRVAPWLGPWPRVADRWLSVAAVGTVVPDLAKLYLVVDADAVAAAIGAPVRWSALHTFGPAAAVAGLGALCVARGYRTVAAGWLLCGVCLHLLLDLTVVRVAGVAPPYLFPLTWWEPPSANLLLSSDPWPVVVAVAVAGGVWAVDRRN
jgi:membrane-bound metal-dependent hydrolase YbcI (DUF457 family)